MSLADKLDNIDKFRFGIVDTDGNSLSNVWFMQGEGQGVYVAPSGLGGSLKLSFHPPGMANDGCDTQFGHPRNYADQARTSGFSPMRPIRWKRTPTPELGASHVASILFPTVYLKSAAQPPSDGKIRFGFLNAPAGSSIEFGLFLSKEHPSTLERKFIALGSNPVGYSDFPCGEFMSLVVREADHRALFEGVFPPNGSPHLLDGAPNVGETVDARMIVASEAPVLGSAFLLAEIGPIKVTRNAE
jgi:hypothetical protein